MENNLHAFKRKVCTFMNLLYLEQKNNNYILFKKKLHVCQNNNKKTNY